MSSKIKVILFDIGNVLIKVNLAKSLEALQKTHPKYESNLLIKELMQSTLYHDFEMDRMPPDIFFSEVQKTYALEGLVWENFTRIWNACLHEPVLNVEKTIRELSKRLPLYGLSNTNKIHYDFFMQRHTFFSHFQAVYTSFEFNLRKPDPKIYQRTFEAISQNHKINLSEILFIDDLPENILAAQNFGYSTALMKNEDYYLDSILRFWLTPTTQ